MNQETCVQCGREIENRGVRFHGNVFCSDECCDEYDAACVKDEDPDPAELDNDVLDDEVTEELGYRTGTEAELLDDDLQDDEFTINPDDF